MSMGLKRRDGGCEGRKRRGEKVKRRGGETSGWRREEGGQGCESAEEGGRWGGRGRRTRTEEEGADGVGKVKRRGGSRLEDEKRRGGSRLEGFEMVKGGGLG